MNFASSNGIDGSQLVRFENLFTDPLPSMKIHVYYSTDIHCKHQKIFPLEQILCKLVAVVIENEAVFIPLLHTLPSNGRL